MKKNIEIILKKQLDNSFNKKQFNLELNKEEKNFLNINMCRYVLFIDNYKKTLILKIYSSTKYTRAGDLLRYLMGNLSIFSDGEIINEENDDKNICSWCLAKVKFINEFEFLPNMKKEIEYFANKYDTDTKIIDARKYFLENHTEIEKWTCYKKKNILRSYVELNKIKKALKLKEDEEIILKTFENESGIALKVTENKLIMVGTSGETYILELEKFNKLYRSIEVSIDEVVKDYKIIPEAVLKKNNKEFSLIEYMKICEPKKLNRVYAKGIDSGIYKIFSKYAIDTNNYYYGIGNLEEFYITVDIDEPTSVHIVRKQQFEQSYELSN